MTSKKFLSNKKTTQQTISISPSLKEWINRYVNVMNRKHPTDERYKSVSSFICNVMESALQNFEKGKTLDDFEKIPDTEIKNFYDKFTFKAVIPHFERGILLNKYNYIDFKSTPLLFLKYQNFVLDSDDQEYKRFDLIDRFKKFMISNNLTKEFRVDTVDDKFIIEYVGNYKNLHFENSKVIAGIFGALGYKINDFIYLEKDLYSRFDIIRTDLSYSKDLKLKERRKIFNHNLEKVVNYNRILNDEAFHLWIKMSRDKDTLITFLNENVSEKWIKTIEEDLRLHGFEGDFILNLLKLFENLHWIKIHNETDLSFHIKLLEEDNDKEIKFLINTLSKYAKVLKVDEYYKLG